MQGKVENNELVDKMFTYLSKHKFKYKLKLKLNYNKKNLQFLQMVNLVPLFIKYMGLIILMFFVSVLFSTYFLHSSKIDINTNTQTNQPTNFNAVEIPLKKVETVFLEPTETSSSLNADVVVQVVVVLTFLVILGWYFWPKSEGSSGLDPISEGSSGLDPISASGDNIVPVVEETIFIPMQEIVRSPVINGDLEISVPVSVILRLLKLSLEPIERFGSEIIPLTQYSPFKDFGESFGEQWHGLVRFFTQTHYSNISSWMKGEIQTWITIVKRIYLDEALWLNLNELSYYIDHGLFY